MTTIHWRTGISGSFNDAFDWSPIGVPNANDDVVIGVPGTYTVTVSSSHTIRSLTTAKAATLAVTHGTLDISHGTGAGPNAGTISVANGAALEIAGTFDNTGKITLNSTGAATDLIIAANVTLSGGGAVILSSGGLSLGGGHDSIVGAQPLVPFPFSIFTRPVTLTNVDNTIEGAGTIGGRNLALNNEATILGNSRNGALTLNTGTLPIRNSGVVEGTTARGVVIDSNVANSGTLEANGPNARLVIEGTVTDSGPGSVRTSGEGAHVDLLSASIVGGAVVIGSGGTVQSLADNGASTISGAAVSGTGTLQANSDSRLNVTNGTIADTVGLESNGIGSVLDVSDVVGANVGTINSGEIEFGNASAAQITFAQGQVGTLKLDSSFTGTVSGLAGAIPQSFTNFFVFGDSTVDSGALQYLSPDLPKPPNPGLTERMQNALAAGGTNSPVGVGLMNTQILAADFGLTANTAYAPGGGGTNYAISGALDAADSGNGGVGNYNQAGKPNPNPALLSTVDQLKTYLNSVGGHADPSALFLISSGGNDVTYAQNFITDSGQQLAYVRAQADALAAEIETLSADGAEHILVNPIMGSQNLSAPYSTELFNDLDQSGIAYTKSDVHGMVQDVLNNPTAYGFTATTVQPGQVGTNTESALIEPDTDLNAQGKPLLTGWGLWGANTTTAQDPNVVPLNQQYAYLSSPDAEQTHFFSDDQHLSAAGQQIQANLDYNLIADDAIDLTSLAYAPGHTVASFSGTPASGTLSVTNGTDSANITLLGNYMAAAFVTASDGTGGTLVMDQSTSSSLPQLAVPHG
jgi:phospholipase/lecithinase/hemolysin